MPFTFSHPAIVLPFARLKSKYISASAIIAGSMAPDFEYFINMEMKQVHGHTISGMFYYCLPITIVLTFLFHYAVRDAIIKYSPIPLKKELNEFYGYDWWNRFKSYWWVVLYSSLLGIASHLFWDEWTHAGRFFVDHIPFLQVEHHFAGKKLLNAEIFWIISSILGGIAVIIAACAPTLDLEKKQKLIKGSIYWGVVGMITMIVMLLRGVHSFNVMIATSIAGVLIGLILAPIIMKWLKIERKILHKESN